MPVLRIVSDCRNKKMFGWKTFEIVQNMYHTKVHNVCVGLKYFG